MKLLVATVWAYADRPVEESPLWQSCRRLGVSLHVSQAGQTYVSHYQNKVVNLAADIDAKDWDFVLYADGDDSFLTRRPEEAVAALPAYGTDFLVSAEVICWPCPDQYTGNYPSSSALCRYPNAGVWLATRAGWEREYAALNEIAVSGTLTPEAVANDQRLVHERIASGRSRMRVDDRGLLCLNLHHHPASPAGIRRDVLLGNAPPVVHGSGGAKRLAGDCWRAAARLADLRAESRYAGPKGVSPVPVPAGPEQAHNQVGGLIDLIRSLPPLGAVAEVGCYVGVSTEAWALLADRVYAVDGWWDAGACDAFLRRMAGYPNVQPVRADSLRAAKVFPDNSLDLVYVDADHSYEAVKADILAWLPKVKAGGWIAGHDHMEYWNCGGVIRAVAEVLGGPDRVFGDMSWLVQIV